MTQPLERRYNLKTGEWTVRKNSGRRMGSPDQPCTYNTAHQRVRLLRGPAKNYQCTECEQPAEEWSYNHRGAFEWSEVRHTNRATFHITWSGDPADYEPMCHSCHIKFDKHHAKESAHA